MDEGCKSSSYHISSMLILIVTNSGIASNLLTRDVRDVKRLYLSGELASFLPVAFRLFARPAALFIFFCHPSRNS